MLFLAMALTFGVAAGVTALLVPPVARLCEQRGWMVPPGPRRIHRVPMPTVGGLAIVAGIVAALLATFLFDGFVPQLQRSPFEYLRLGLLLCGMLIIAAVSFIDDLRDLPALPRLAVHFGAGLVAVGPYLWDHQLYPDVLGNLTEARGIILTAFNFPFINQIHLHNLSPWLAIIATVLWISVIQNMVNWSDGMDGLAAGVTLIAATVLALHTLSLNPPQWTIALLPLALAGACAGFLPFNFFPARIFMGDVGAMTIGYVLAVSAIIGGAKLATALLVIGVPLIDMAWLIIWRLMHGRSAATAGRDHLHHRLLDMGFSQRQVVAFYYTLSAAFGGIALLDVMTPAAKLAALLVLGGLVIGLLIYASTRTPQQLKRDA
ncbi:MAG: undecaprenyl/decaprenyl-phosphate alpha-N-acetylglucosaminyl 1-phosphate transferase [Chloroflexaceae bacterium]|jgi:UDP-N-acetylmuramyl pentapeptide phosphotransferase/UDP-N-acetylglucosamine-1-phosphate transferase|nr:undecaprenyl/decaprenyl-phosphate alpha-N-acetylglucosaminyl 1-phosphate transferase [Chloroflexaceae bacterium]